MILIAIILLIIGLVNLARADRYSRQEQKALNEHEAQALRKLSRSKNQFGVLVIGIAIVFALLFVLMFSKL